VPVPASVDPIPPPGVAAPVRVATLIGLVVLAVPAGLAAQLGSGGGERVVPVPPDRRPPGGMCRVWLDGVPAGQQPAPTSCDQAAKVHAPNAHLIVGTDHPTEVRARAVRVMPGGLTSGGGGAGNVNTGGAPSVGMAHPVTPIAPTTPSPPIAAGSVAGAGKPNLTVKPKSSPPPHPAPPPPPKVRAPHR
jgi:hypothetical protein